MGMPRCDNLIIQTFRLLLVLEVLTFVAASDCGTLSLSPVTVRENDNVQLIYTYNEGNRYSPRLWYRLRGQQWTKLYDSTQSPSGVQKYDERFHNNRFILTLPAVTFNDAGIYVILCSTDSHKQSQSVELKVLPRNLQQGLCGRLDILSNGSPLGSRVHFVFKANAAQSDVIWEAEVNGQYLNIGRDPRVEITRNIEHTIFVRKLYSEASDVGTYRVRCADGSVSNIVELLPKIRVFNIIPPSQPVIQNVTSYPGCTNCLLAIPSRLLTITCFSYNGSAPVDLQLYFNSVKIGQAVSIEVTNRRIIVEKQQAIKQTDDNVVVRCQAQNLATDQPLVTEANIYLFRAPDPPIIEAPVMVEGQAAAITCISEGGRPAPSLHFIYKQRTLRPETKISFNETSGNSRVVSALLVNLSRSDNFREIECRSEILDSKEATTKLLTVKFPPQKVSINKVKQVSNAMGDTNLTLRCTVAESNPKSSVAWQQLNTLIRSENHGNSQLDAGNNGGWMFKHELTVPLSKKDNRKEITCAVINTEFPDLVLQTQYRINIPYQPIVRISGGSNKTVVAGSDVTITCSVDSNPRSRIRWVDGDNQLTATDGDGRLSLDLKLFNISSQEDSNVYTCIAENGVGDQVTQNITIYMYVREKGLAVRRVSPDSDDGATIAGILCGILLVVAIVIIVLFFAIRRRRRSGKDTQNTAVQIRIENRQPSIQPQVDEPVYNNVNVNAVNVTEEPAVYARVIPKSQRETATLADESNNAEYAQVIPKSQRKPVEIVDDTNNAEYATVIPKSQRQTTHNNTSDTKQVSQPTGNLVYADLDLHTSNVADLPPDRHTQRTEYVTIDFAKSKETQESDSIG